LRRVELADAEKQGLLYEGDRRLARRFQPRHPSGRTAIKR
jgi:hypothetical protein